MDYTAIPSAIFTMPEIGVAGLSQAEAKQKEYLLKLTPPNFRTLGKAHAINEIAGAAKIIVEKNTQTVLGVHIIGPHGHRFNFRSHAGHPIWVDRTTDR